MFAIFQTVVLFLMIKDKNVVFQDNVILLNKGKQHFAMFQVLATMCSLLSLFCCFFPFFVVVQAALAWPLACNLYEILRAESRHGNDAETHELHNSRFEKSAVTRRNLAFANTSTSANTRMARASLERSQQATQAAIQPATSIHPTAQPAAKPTAT